MPPTPLHSKATRRVPMTFDDNGDPTFPSVCSPTSFTPRAMAVLMPRHVIPVIFLPGVMGTNLRMTKEADPNQAPAWTVPNGTVQSLREVFSRQKQLPKDRQLQLTPWRTEVDDTGKVSLSNSTYTLTEKEARRRGWGELHYDSYGVVLAELERSLNDQYQDPGKGDKKLPVWEIAQTLKKPGQRLPPSGEGDTPPEPEPIDVRKVWNPIKGEIAALTDDEFKQVNGFYFPVWACGFNWLDSCEASAQRLMKKIDEALAWYDKSNYFIGQGKVIIVSHSMGGLVTRRAAQQAQSKILGVVHSVQPVSGAPVVYRRFRAGTEVDGFFDIAGAAAATIIGWDAADITCVMANAPGPMELLPTKQYPAGWLNVELEVKGKREKLFSLPESDPYEEIYSLRVQDVWWGMVDETLIDPAELAKTRKKTPIEMYRDALTAAMDFHDQVQLECHPNTYAHYGSDADQVSFGSVHWVTRTTVPEDMRARLKGMQVASGSWTKLGEVTLGEGDKAIKFKPANKANPKSDDDANAGDGTVPNPSGAVIQNSDGAAHVFRMKGFDHQHSYCDPDVLNNVMYCIAKITQKATPAKDLPQCKGTSSWTDTDSNSQNSSSPASSASAS